jgi:LDH2 family malate/lactate/ureidoglycolate dehydrogenase
MATITFDTLKFVERLRAGGVPEEQAKAEAEALVATFAEAMDSQLASKSTINRLEHGLWVIKWMVGVVIGGIFALVLKAFFQV